VKSGLIKGSEGTRQVAGGEKAFVVIVLLLSLGAFANLTVTGPIQTQNMGMLGMQVLWSSLYLIMLMLYSRNCSEPLRTLLRTRPFMILLAFTFLSAIWSEAPGLTLRRSIALALTFVFGAYLASRFTLKEQFRLLAWAFAICIVFSFIFELLGLNPSEGIPGWYGVFFHKTELGRNFAVGALVFLFWTRVDPDHRKLALLGFTLSAILVLLSRDVTSLVTLFVLLIVFPYVERVVRWNPARAIAAIVALLMFGALSILYVSQHLGEVTGLLGKDPQLTGRVPLWILSVAMALRRPWLGYGFSAFWIPDYAYTQRIWHILGWMPPHAHNGVLELWLELGLIGTSIFMLIYIHYCLRAVRLLRQTKESVATWPLVFLLFFFITNFTESFFVTTNSIYFLLYVTSAFMCKEQESPRIGGAAVIHPSYA
jgi:exopolysaccharide production protein ExoQ